MYLTFAGMEKVAQISQNTQAIKNREAVLVLLKQEYAALRSTMHVQAPVASAGPIAQAAVLAAPEMDLIVKKRQMERDDALFEMEMAERKQRLLQLTADSEREHLIKIADSYRELCQDTVMDERMRLMLKDGFMNLALAAQKGFPCQGLLTDGGGVSPNTPTSLSLVANDLKLKIADGDWQSIGIELSNRYYALHGKRPSKHRQTIDGKILEVCDYYERDRPLLEEVLRWHVGGRDSEQNGEQASPKKDRKKSGNKSKKEHEQNNGQKKIQNFMSSRQEKDV